jgi:hypothetical protein
MMTSTITGWVPFRNPEAELTMYVRAEIVAPGLAVHPDPFEHSAAWTITHIPSGANVWVTPDHFSAVLVAERFAKHLDWGDDYETIRATIRGIAGETELSLSPYGLIAQWAEEE